MVDWDRVEELREKDWDWNKIASDAKVGFKPDAAVGQPGPALRRLYYRRQSRAERTEVAEPISRRRQEESEKKWPAVRYTYLAVPAVGIWAALAFAAPSPVGVVVPALYLFIALALGAAILGFLLYITTGKRWSTLFRSTVIGGIVVGLVIGGGAGLTALLLYGCPYLPPAISLTSEPGPGWASASVTPWHENGLPVFYFYGATWCPYCSASSWALWKALSEFENPGGSSSSTNPVPGAIPYHSSLSDVYPGTPEMMLAGVSLSSKTIAFQVSEDTSNVDGNFPGTSNCIQQAYYSAYGGSSIPFVALNGQYIHGGSTVIDPSLLTSYNWGNTGSSGLQTMQTDVIQETGTPWSVVANQAEWIAAFLCKAANTNPTNLHQIYTNSWQWTSGFSSAVNSDLAEIGG